MSNHDVMLVRAKITPAVAVYQFMSEYADALVSAARLLGGDQAAQRTSLLINEVLQRAPLCRHLRAEFVDLHRLLSLQAVDDLESIEAACLAEIDPASPVVEEVCLLSDGLFDHLVALARAEYLDPVWRPVLDAAA